MDILETHIGKIKAEFQKLDSDKLFYKNSSEQLLKNSSQLHITNDKDSLVWRSHQVLKLEIETLKRTIEEEQNKNALLQDELKKNALLQVEKQDLKENLQLKNIMEEDIKNNNAKLVIESSQALREEIEKMTKIINESKDESNRNAVLAEKEVVKEHVQVINGPMKALREENERLKKIIEDERKNNAVIQAQTEGVKGHSQVKNDVMESSQSLRDENESLKKTIEDERNKNALLRLENDDMNVNYGNLQRALGYLRFEYSYLQEKNKDQPENKDALLVGSEVMDHINLEVELGHLLCDNKQLTVENEDLKVQLYDMELNCKNSVHECHLLRSQNGYLQATIEKLQEDILQSTNKAQQSKIKKLGATNKDIQEDRDMLQGDNNTLQANIKELEATIKDIQEDRDMLQRDNNTLQANIKQLEATKTSMKKRPYSKKINNDLEAKIMEANMEPQENDGLLMNDNLLQGNVKAKIKAFEQKGRERVKDLPRQAEVCYGEIKQKKTLAWKTCKSILKHGFKKNSKSKDTSQSNGNDLKQWESVDELNVKIITHSSKKISKNNGDPQSNDIEHEQSGDEINGKMITHRSKKISKNKGNPQSNDIEHEHEHSGDELNGIISTHGSKTNSESKGETHSDGINMKQGKSGDKLSTTCDNEHQPDCSGSGLKAKCKHLSGVLPEKNRLRHNTGTSF
ncbi:synaptonemal complex protein 1-like [Sander lucioperca]|uniref:synaptonemal complex protein 1-like n=1 Tax=Sander lucioperca TaxID=283035 RepID=UPI00125D479A|nr:synaptonemal complex protein 1-like [Sander lucioperca]